MPKFTIEQVLENIKASFTNDEGKSSLQISDRTITETLNPFLSLVGEEMELSEFVEKYGKSAIDSANRNLIKMNADFTKSYKPTTPPDSKPKEFDMDKFFEKFAETQKQQQDAFSAALKPLQEKIGVLEQEKNNKLRSDAIAVKKAELKLSKSWEVDFDNSVELMTIKLGKEATADAIYEKAFEHFNQTLSRRGETYKPLEGSDGDSKPDFSGVKAVLKIGDNK
jgi:hypothetical protein